MKCEKFQRVAGQMARNEIMDAQVRAQALAHTTVCKDCAEVLDLQSVLSEGLRSLAEHTKNAGPGIDLEHKVLAAFRERTSVVSLSASSGYWRYWGAAVAAVLLLAIGLAAWRWSVAPVPQQSQQASSRELAGSSNRRELRVATAGERPAPKPPNVSPLGRFRRRPKPAARTTEINVARQSLKSLPGATPPATQEVVTHFVSLGYGSALDLQDGAQMVRVELPRSALARFGLPMNMDRAEERITADVLIGADGLARAIRFVQPTDQTTGDPRSGNERNEQ